MPRYDIGDLVTVSASFTDRDGQAADPDAVTLTILKPDGTIDVIDHDELDNPDVGTYEYDVDVDQERKWRYRFEGTGSVVAADEQEFTVRLRTVPEPP